jgi:hypothetical protein
MKKKQKKQRKTEVQIHAFSTSLTDGGQLTVSRSNPYRWDRRLFFQPAASYWAIPTPNSRYKLAFTF